MNVESKQIYFMIVNEVKCGASMENWKPISGQNIMAIEGYRHVIVDFN
jgi:hypothetical protein